MESEGGTASIDEISQGIMRKEDSRAQTQRLNNLDHINQHSNEFTNATKIFVGGLPANLTKVEFKAYFEKFGSIEDVVVICDKVTNKPRRFGFVTFDSPETANNVLNNRYYELKNKRVEVKKAVSKERMTSNFGNYHVTYNAMYNGNTLPYCNYGGYYHGMNSSGYRYGLSCEGLPYFYYTYQNLNPSYDYYNTCFYQYPYYCADTYSYKSPYNCYGNTPKPKYKYRNRTPVVIKKNSHVNNGDGDHALGKNAISLQVDDVNSCREECKKNSHVNNGDGDHAVGKHANLGFEVNDEESVARGVLENGDGDHAEISDSLRLCCDREVEGSGGGGGGGGGGGCCCSDDIQALSMYSGSGEPMGADRQSSSCTCRLMIYGKNL